MSVNKFLQNWFQHIDLIIEIQIAIFIFLMGAVVYLLFRGGRSPHESSDGGTNLNLKEIEATLRKVIDTAPPTPMNVVGTASPGPVDVNLLNEINSLKENLRVKEQNILELSKHLAEAQERAALAATSGAVGGANSDLEEQIRHLEARLLEYEIIEDDIADLSLFKEENARLKSEVRDLREKLDNARLNSAPLTGQEPSSAAVSTRDSSQTPTDRDDVSASFEQFVADFNSKNQAAESLGSVGPSANDDAPGPGAQGGNPEVQDQGVDPGSDAKPSTHDDEPNNAAASRQPQFDQLANLDTERMLSEIDQLNQIRETKAVNIDEITVDPDRLLNEVTPVAQETPEPGVPTAAGETKDDDDLAEQFRNFVKGT